MRNLRRYGMTPGQVTDYRQMEWDFGRLWDAWQSAEQGSPERIAAYYDVETAAREMNEVESRLGLPQTFPQCEESRSRGWHPEPALRTC